MVLNLRHKGVFLDVVTYFLFIFGVLVFFGAGVGGIPGGMSAKEWQMTFGGFFPC